MLGMRRREFITLLGGAAAALPLSWPSVADAQRSGQTRRVGVLMNGLETEPTLQSYLAAFVQALRALGWTEGQNLQVDARWNGGDAERARAYATELVALTPEVITCASTTNLSALQRATRSIPIVFVQVSDPVAQGFVLSLAHPGGNITGFSAYEFSIAGKWVDLLKQIAPDLVRVGVLFNPNTSPQTKFFLPSIEAATATLGMQTVPVQVRTPADIDPAIRSFADQPNGGLILPTDSFTRGREKLIVELAARYRVPAISASVDFPKNGGLMYYGGATIEQFRQHFRQAASYVDRILKGAKPADLPVQQTTKYSLVINLGTARTLELDPPMGLLLRADEVIE